MVPSDEARSIEKRTLAFSLLAAMILALPFLWPVASGGVLHADDIGRFHLPTRDFFSRALADGSDWRWHPGLYCGYYLHGEGQAGMAHPFHRLIYGVLPLDRAFAIEVAIGYPVLFAGMFFLLRRLGLRADAAAIGALSFAFSRFAILRYVHVNAIEILAHLPWMLLAVEAISARIRTGRSPVPPTMGLALLIASGCLLGYPQYVGFDLIVVSLFAAWRLGRSRRGWLALIEAIALGALMGAGQILPNADALGGSWRARPTLAFLGIDSLHPLNLLQIVSPRLFRFGHFNPDGPPGWPIHERVASLGAMFPVACAWFWLRRRDLGSYRPAVLWSLGLIGLGLALSLGKYSPLFPLIAKLPLMRMFRGPARFVVVAQLGASLLVALCVADLARLSSPVPRRPLRILLIPMVVGIVAGLGLWFADRAGLIAGQVESIGAIAIGLLVASIPIALVALIARGGQRWMPLLVVFLGFEAWEYALAPMLKRDIPSSIETLRGPSLPDAAGQRLSGPLNEGLLREARLLEGYVALTPRKRLDPRHPKTLRIAGVGFIRQEGEPWRSLASSDPLPRARLVEHAVVAPDPKLVLDSIDPATTVTVDREIPLLESGGTARTIEDRPGRIRVETSASGSSFLVVNESFHSGWKATIDGEETQVVRSYGDFLGCAVQGGKHEVVLGFDPGSDRMGTRLAVLAAVVMAFRFFTCCRTERSSIEGP